MAKYNSRRSQEEWVKLITKCRHSGLADNAWCEQNNVPPSSFYNAVTRLRKKACAIPETTAPSDHTYALDFTSRQEVVRVDICPDSCQQPFSPCIDVPKPAMHLDFSHTIELVVDNFRVKISNAADPKLLAEILDGLCAIIKEEFSMDMDHALFLFCGLRCDGIKAILKEPDGIVLIYKRLTAQGRYRWPRDKSEVRNLTWKEFDWLMSGIDIDQPKAIRTS